MTPLVVIVGPTASGKSELAIRLAERHNGEIICADSRTIYKHMDIGTAKASKEDQQRVRHWGIDLVEPGERFTVAEYQAYALEKIADIRARGKVPFLVGGSGLYVDAVILEYEFGSDLDKKRRDFFTTMTLEQLHIYCREHNVVIPNNSQNKRYVIRAIEMQGVNTKRRASPGTSTLVVGIATHAEVLRQRITTRADQVFNNGVIEEALCLADTYGWESEAMTGNIYKLVRKYSSGTLAADELKRAFVTADWQLAKRQLTWFKRRPFIEWGGLEESEQRIEQYLAQVNNT
jgi:tRNA dimethylallyltransferase